MLEVVLDLTNYCLGDEIEDDLLGGKDNYLLDLAGDLLEEVEVEDGVQEEDED